MKHSQTPKKIRLGLVGYGYWGPNLVRNFLQIPNISSLTVCDIDQKRLRHVQNIYPHMKTTKVYEDLLDTTIDAIVIASPFTTHFALARKALEKKKHVLIEKPFVTSTKEAELLIALAKKNNRILMIDHTFEYSGGIEKMKQVVEQKMIGDIYTIDMTRVNLGLFQKDHNVIWDLAYHDISILLYVLKKMPKTVRVVGKDFIQKGIVDTAYIIVTFTDNTIVSIHVSWLDPSKVRRITIVGSKKMLTYDDLEPTEKIKIFDKGVLVKNNTIPSMHHYDSFYEFSYLYRSGNIFIPKLSFDEPIKKMAKHFVAAILFNKKPQSDGEKGLQIVTILEAMQCSLEQNGKEIYIS